MSGRPADTCFAGVFSCTSCTHPVVEQPFWKLSQFHFPLYKRPDPADLLHRLAETNATIGTAFGQKKKNAYHSRRIARAGYVSQPMLLAGPILCDFSTFTFTMHAPPRAPHTHTHVSGWAVECFCVSAV